MRGAVRGGCGAARVKSETAVMFHIRTTFVFLLTGSPTTLNLVSMTKPSAKIWTVQELADYLSVSDDTVYRMIEDGRLKGSFQIGDRGSSWRIPDEVVLNYLRRKMEGLVEKTI